MDYKKLYKEALERATDAHKDTDRHLKATLERIFPELKENEDERTRKDIATYLRSVISNKGYDDKIIESWITWLEKQGEQSSWSEKDEKFLNYAISLTDDVQIKNFLKSLKERVQPKSMQEWSEEDKYKLGFLIEMLEGLDSKDFDLNYMKELSNWLKSLKPQNRWKPSEQNIKDLEWCANLFKDKMGVGFHRLQVFIDELKNNK